MKSFQVTFHQEDQADQMVVKKLSEADFNAAIEGGMRQLFELDTNIGLFIFVDGEDKDGGETYHALRFQDEKEEPSDYYSFELKDFYEFIALFTSQMYIEDDESESDEEAYEPIHHLAHLFFHIVESGEGVTP
ncbi:hypothetical protein [Bacillus andreraoultii]|uniref:hypothetical protein n=1 Tax=Bacillus andreraoultii TaxID=1499685 RepID=UPI0005398B12|nr:hypothetical protein [Bacillus andreraoultii]